MLTCVDCTIGLILLRMELNLLRMFLYPSLLPRRISPNLRPSVTRGAWAPPPLSPVCGVWMFPPQLPLLTACHYFSFPKIDPRITQFLSKIPFPPPNTPLYPILVPFALDPLYGVRVFSRTSARASAYFPFFPPQPLITVESAPVIKTIQCLLL